MEEALRRGPVKAAALGLSLYPIARPGASHFAALSIASPNWRNAYQVATIGDHTFYKVQNLKPRQS